MAEPDRITHLLQDVDAGRDGALDALMSAVYDDLHRLAQHHMDVRFGRGLAGVTWEPAALVNESFMKLIRQRKAFDNRGQFFAIATRIMVRVLVDYQRQRLAQKRGGGAERVTLSLVPPGEDVTGTPETAIEIERLVDGLARLEKEIDARKADVVRLRVIWGLEMREIAESLDVSLATIERDWAFAKAWLAREAATEESAAPTEPE